MARKEQDLNKVYAQILRKRQENIDQSPTRGDIARVKRAKLSPDRVSSETLSDVISDIKNKGAVVENVSDVVKTTPTDTMGIDPSNRNKSKFFNLDKKLGGIRDVVKEEAGLLKNQKGFSKILPMLGLAGVGLAGLSIAGKVQAGELGEAGLESADLATDYVPGVSQVKMALRHTELGSAELPPELMEERAIYNAARKAGQTGTPSNEQPLLAPEDRATYEEMKKKVNFNVLNRLK